MSLHKFAEQVASQGRGDDSLLVHMTPDEVRNLQKFAEANGTTLTINPTTGLPEAGLLSDLFKAVAPIALGAFLGPGAFGIAGLGMSAGMAGLTAGGLTTLATGSLSRGLMAGLGAYGGAGLAEGFMGAGVGAAQQSAMGSLSADQIASEMANTELTKQGVLNQAAADATKSAMANTGQAVSSGFNVATATPSAMGAFAKQNLGNIAAAAAPIMAGQMVPTTTKMPENTNPAYIRQKLYDPYTQTYKSLAPVKASEFGGRNFSDAYTNPQTGQMATLDERKPTPMAGGGIVALAGGGDVIRMAAGTPPAMLSDEALYQKTGSWEAAAAARDAQNNALNAYNNQQAAAARDAAANAANQATWNTQAKARDDAANAANAATWAKNAPAVVPDASDWWAKQSGGVDALYSTINQQLAANPNMTDAQIDAAMKQYGISNEDVAAALRKGGGSQAQEYSMLAGNMGLSGLNTNINDWLAKARRDPTFNAKTGLQQQEAARAAMGTVNMNEADVLRATGKTIAELFPSTLTKPISVIPGGTQLPGATVYDNGAYGNYGSGPATGVDYLGRTVSIATPGDIITNPDGTVTVVPNIPGRPYGGFTGMDQVKSKYTAGGGSLGYTAPIPKDPEASFNKMTDDSLTAYNFLMGKGKNLAQVNAASNKTLMQPYFTGSNRYKQKFLSYDKDGKVVTSTTGGSSSSDKATGTAAAGTTAVIGGANFDLTDPTRTPAEDNNGPWSWDVASKKWVQYGKFADGGITGYAMGGGLGSLGSYSDGGRLLKGPGDGVSDSIPATIGSKNQPARLADGEFVIPARIVSELGNGSTDAGAKKLYAMMDRVQRARGKTTGKNKVAANSRADKHLPA